LRTCVFFWSDRFAPIAVPAKPIAVEIGAAPSIELVRQGGWGWHRGGWHDRWGYWHRGRCTRTGSDRIL
jgi:hypothetical protein